MVSCHFIEFDFYTVLDQGWVHLIHLPSYSNSEAKTFASSSVNAILVLTTFFFVILWTNNTIDPILHAIHVQHWWRNISDIRIIRDYVFFLTVWIPNWSIYVFVFAYRKISFVVASGAHSLFWRNLEYLCQKLFLSLLNFCTCILGTCGVIPSVLLSELFADSSVDLSFGLDDFSWFGEFSWLDDFL